MASALENIFSKCFTETPPKSGIYIQISTTAEFLIGGNYADGNGFAFSTYVKLLQGYNIDTLINSIDNPPSPYTQFSGLVEDLINFRKDSQ